MRSNISLALSISLLAAPLGANQPSPRSQIGVHQITQKALTTLVVKADKTLTLDQLLGDFKLVKRMESPDKKICVYYAEPSKHPRWTAIIGCLRDSNEVAFLELRQRTNAPASKLEYGDQEAWIPLDNEKVLIWAPYLKMAYLLEARNAFKRKEGKSLNESFIDIDLTSASVSDALVPYKVVPRNDGTDELDIVLNGHRLQMDRRPYYFWK
ncbi:hypothetical protein [Geothrix oryzisoli]|uniref:hypothetical protein n=1 Tax=Geothrix oryzisoli TaxID=2922721 RepID=UPI001FACBB89|nr:hypothetical protein [Geothrix oryzisoli]